MGWQVSTGICILFKSNVSSVLWDLIWQQVSFRAVNYPAFFLPLLLLIQNFPVITWKLVSVHHLIEIDVVYSPLTSKLWKNIDNPFIIVTQSVFITKLLNVRIRASVSSVYQPLSSRVLPPVTHVLQRRVFVAVHSFSNTYCSFLVAWTAYPTFLLFRALD